MQRRRNALVQIEGVNLPALERKDQRLRSPTEERSLGEMRHGEQEPWSQTSATHYTPQVCLLSQRQRLDNFTRILLELTARHRLSRGSEKQSEYSPPVGNACPLHKIRFMRGSAKQFGSEPSCWLR